MSPSTADAVPTEFTAFESLLARRHSCRAFLPQPVPRPVIERVLAAAQRSASWCNAQPWQVHIVGGAALERLRADLIANAKARVPATPELDWPREYTGVYLERRRHCGWSLYAAVGVAKGDREGSARQALENFRLFGAPHMALVTSAEPQGTHGVMDCGAWVSNFMLAATAHGLGTIAQAALATWPDVLRRHIPVPEGRRIVCGIAFGYEDMAHRANSFRLGRASLDDVVSWVA